jgi:exopolyphosphatase/guanosine-5'-triphosphate,3'-diphosphate pyrophosphatase
MCLDKALLMDIGGCSNQLIMVEDKKIVESVSLPYGAINLSTRFDLEKAMEKVGSQIT